MPFIPASAALTCSSLRAESALAFRMRLPKPLARMTALVVDMLGVSRVDKSLRGRALAAHHHTGITQTFVQPAAFSDVPAPANLINVVYHRYFCPQRIERTVTPQRRHLG